MLLPIFVKKKSKKNQLSNFLLTAHYSLLIAHMIAFLAVGHGCNCVRSQCAGWMVPLSPSSCSWSWLQLCPWPMHGIEGAIVACSYSWSWLQLCLWAMRGIEGTFVALLLQLVMVAIMSMTNARDRRRHYCLLLTVGYGCNYVCGQCVEWRAPLSLALVVGHGCNYVRGQCTGWRVPLSPSSCNWSWLQLCLWPMRRIEGTIVTVFL